MGVGLDLQRIAQQKNADTASTSSVGFKPTNPVFHQQISAPWTAWQLQLSIILPLYFKSIFTAILPFGQKTTRRYQLN